MLGSSLLYELDCVPSASVFVRGESPALLEHIDNDGSKWRLQRFSIFVEIRIQLEEIGCHVVPRPHLFRSWESATVKNRRSNLNVEPCISILSIDSDFTM
jgi:hypothetical protein